MATRKQYRAAVLGWASPEYVAQLFRLRRHSPLEIALWLADLEAQALDGAVRSRAWERWSLECLSDLLTAAGHEVPSAPTRRARRPRVA